MLRFGDWLLRQRLDSHLDIKDVAALSGVDIGTLSRIETDKASPILSTVIKLCAGFKLSDSDLLFELGITQTALKPNWSDILYTSYERHEVMEPTVNEVARFYDSYRIQPKETLDSLANDFRSTFDRLQNDIPRELVYAVGFVPYLLAFQPSFLSIEFLRSPYLTEKHILGTFYAGHFITIGDPGFVLQQRRTNAGKALHTNKETLSSSMLSRIERGQVDHIKFVDVIALDRTYGSDHDLFRLFWKATQLQDAYTGEIQLLDCLREDCRVSVYQFINIFIAFWRWRSLNGLI